ncbi:RelA/SpoT domain-containing protein [Vibrio fluvialis]|nr:RelA/SpoT domain-containing protein [Vibrio fluvialis]
MNGVQHEQEVLQDVKVELPELTDQKVEELVQVFVDSRHLFERFMKNVVDTFELEPGLNTNHNPVIYTVKSRIKNADHLRDKIRRKWAEGIELTPHNLFEKITDLAGVRVIHMYQDQFQHIHKLIDSQDWVLNEQAVAYSWDPEATDFFKGFDLLPKIKPSYYTSIHYVVKPKPTEFVCCEIQVRTLFEEIWGEIDHTINYPHQTDNIACREQLRVLSKLVSTGTRLADSIFRTHEDANKARE